jgi:hypothetical protein
MEQLGSHRTDFRKILYEYLSKISQENCPIKHWEEWMGPYMKANLNFLLYLAQFFLGGRDSLVDVAIGYGMDGMGIESLKGRDFSHTPRPTLRPTQPTVQWVQGLSRG